MSGAGGTVRFTDIDRVIARSVLTSFMDKVTPQRVGGLNQSNHCEEPNRCACCLGNFHVGSFDRSLAFRAVEVVILPGPGP